MEQGKEKSPKKLSKTTYNNLACEQALCLGKG